MSRTLATLTAALLLASCGTPAKLRPADGMSAVPREASAQAPETPQQLMTASTQARPDRKADLLLKSAERHVDPFDLPPGKTNGVPGASENAAAPPPTSGGH